MVGSVGGGPPTGPEPLAHRRADGEHDVAEVGQETPRRGEQVGRRYDDDPSRGWTIERARAEQGGPEEARRCSQVDRSAVGGPAQGEAGEVGLAHGPGRRADDAVPHAAAADGEHVQGVAVVDEVEQQPVVVELREDRVEVESAVDGRRRRSGAPERWCRCARRMADSRRLRSRPSVSPPGASPRASRRRVTSRSAARSRRSPGSSAGAGATSNAAARHRSAHQSSWRGGPTARPR